MPLGLFRKIVRKRAAAASSSQPSEPPRQKPATARDAQDVGAPPAKRATAGSKGEARGRTHDGAGSESRRTRSSAAGAEVWKPGDSSTGTPAEGQTDGPPRKRRRRPAGGPRPDDRPAGPRAKPAPIDRSDPDWTPDAFKVEPMEGVTRFHDLELPDALMHGIADLSFEYCTPIQAAVLPQAIAGRNITGQAQTGTGKTAAFLVAIYTRCLRDPIEPVIGRPRALILAPTRELVVQIAADAEALGAYLPLSCVAVYGGMDFDKQAAQVKDAPVTIVAATPGRLLDFTQRRMLDLGGVETLVIDEADRMLDMGFIPDVRRIVRMTPPREQRQTLFFSATLTDDVSRLVAQWVPDPVRVEIEPENIAVDTVEQTVYIVRTEDKLAVLYNLIKQADGEKVLVFANRRDATERLHERLTRLGVPCELLSGAVNQKKRMSVLNDFKAGRINVVVATDVAGRGIHVDRIDTVVNFELPYEPADYVHRIGRTGRAGETGKAVSFACEDESFIIPDIEAYIGRELPCRQPDASLFGDLPPMGPPPKRRAVEPSRGGGQRRGGSGGGRGGRSGGGGRAGGGGGGGRRGRR